MRLYYFVDHTSTWFSNTGVQRVTRYLARAFQDHLADVVPVCWDPRAARLIQPTAEQLRHLANFGGPRVDEADPLAGQPVSLSGLANEWLFIPEVTTLTPHDRAPTADLLGFARKHHMKVASLFYDAIPLKNAEYHEARPAHERYMAELAGSDLIFAISQSSADDLVRFYESSKIHPMPQVIAQLLPAEEMGKARVVAPPPPATRGVTILCVGSIESRKNHLAFFDAFIAFKKAHPKVQATLEVFGHIRADHEAPVKARLTAEPSIHFHGYQDDAVIESWYERAHFTAFPSVDEGFGLPIAESLWKGRPCLCADWGSMAEIGRGGGCEMTDVRRVENMVASLERMVLDENHRLDLTRAAQERPLLTWEGYAASILEKLHGFDGLRAAPTPAGLVYYYVHHTVDYPGNTGIQRVTRGLARAIEENGVTPVYVKWNNPDQKFEPIDGDQMAHLGKWNGPRGPGKPFPPVPTPGAWMVFPELPYFPGSFDFKNLIDKAKSMGWRTAHVFYDVIPWKMKHLYPVAAVGEHQKYMQQLRMVDAVWSISHFSRAELRRFWREEGGMGEREESILGALPLPGEFLQSPRVTDPAPHPTGTHEPIRFLSVGTVEPRKNHLSLLQAWKIFRKRNPDLAAELLIVGGAPYPELEQQVRGLMAEAGGATWVKSPSDPEVRAAYAACDVTVYPSVEEGFGLPVLESLWYAKPSICHEGSSLRELGIGGGCCMVDMYDAAAIAAAMERVVKDRAFRETLLAETIRRPLKTWKFYGQEVLADMALRESLGPAPAPAQAPIDGKEILLSVCISTYNRSRWLRLGLAKVLVEFLPHMDKCEILVVDNTSTDDTAEILDAFARSFPIRVHRNEKNVGMLGNLAVTATLARGKHVWILGDDDFIADGIAPKVLCILARHPALPLIYLNYAYSHGELPGDLREVKSFIQSGTPLVPVPQDVYDRTKNISVLNENFFTSIYALIFRKDHGVGAYTQDTSGRPFSNLVTCVPTTAYVISRMFDEMAYFVSQPALCVSLAVSWMRYAPLYHLERYPDMFDGALAHGAPPEGILALQEKLFPHGMGQLRLVYDADDEIRGQFSMERWIRRHRHLHPFQDSLAEIRGIYAKAWEAGKVIADTKGPDVLFPR